MRRIEQTGQFKRDYRREKKGRHRAILDTAFLEVVNMLVNDQPLADKYRDHRLTNNWSDHRDCHIKPDLILIYRQTDNGEALQLIRLGSHSELGL